MPPKARKSQGKPASSRTARKHLTGSSGSDEENTPVNTRRSSTGRSETDDRDDSDSDDVRQQLVSSKSPGRGGNRSAAAKKPTSSGAGRGKGKGGKSIAAVKSTAGKKRKATETTEDSEESDSEDRAEVTSGSNSKSRSSGTANYNWETEMIELTPADITEGKLRYHKQISTTVIRHNPDGEEVEFKRGDTIFVLPDRRTLPKTNQDVDVEELDDQYFWVCEILDCCSLDQSSQNGTPLGLLKVQWYYNGDQALNSFDWHEGTKKKIKAWHWRDWEYISSDHIDFIGLEAYAGHADISWRLRINGLKLPDTEIVKKPAKRAKIDAKKGKIEMLGFSKTDPSTRTWPNNVRDLAERERKAAKDAKARRRSGRSDRDTAVNDDE